MAKRRKNKGVKSARAANHPDAVDIKSANGQSIDQRAMLATLTVNFWTGRRKDSTTTDEITTKKHADDDAGVWWTRTIPPSSLRGLRHALSTARKTHYGMTMPWMDNGFRILPATMFFDYSKAMRECETAFMKEKDKFLREYPKLAADAIKRLGDLAKNVPIPTVDELRDKFPWGVKILPIPTAGDFRVDLGADAEKEIRAGIETETAAAVHESMRDLWQRLYDQVEHIAEKLNDSKGVFRDSLISNITELCELLPKMNVTGDADLETARQSVLAKLSKRDPEILRKNKTVRADAAKSANDILKTMKDFMG